MSKKDLKSHVQSKNKGGYWKGGKHTKPVYENTQYRGGRKEGRKNLVKLENGNIRNQHGLEFTQKEKKALESAVNRANRKRKIMLDNEAKLPRLVAGQPTGQTVGTLQTMGKESDFIISRKSKSLQRFKTREQYEKYMKNLERVLSDDYIVDRIRLYKRNHIKAIENVFGDDAKDVVMKIRMMKPKDYMQMIQSDEMLEVNYIYDPSDKQGKLNQIRGSLGMNLKEDYINEE